MGFGGMIGPPKKKTNEIPVFLSGVGRWGRYNGFV